MTVYDIGDRPTVTGTFRDGADALTDPTTVTVRVREPDGTETLYTSPTASIVNSSTGVWAFTFPAALDAVGDWYVRFRSTAGLLTAAELKLTVRPTAFTTP
jgi:hypothetical protein